MERVFEFEHPVTGEIRKIHFENAFVENYFRMYMNTYGLKGDGAYAYRLLALPTGSGKSYASVRALSIYVKFLGKKHFFSKEQRPVVFVSPLKDNLPIIRQGVRTMLDEEELPERECEKFLYGDKGQALTKEEFTEYGYVSRSMEERYQLIFGSRSWEKNVKSGVRDFAERPDSGFTERDYLEWQQYVSEFEAYSDDGVNRTRDAERLQRVDSKLRKSIRRYIHNRLCGLKSQRGRNGRYRRFSPEEYLKFLENNRQDFGWVLDFYDDVFLVRKKIIFMSAHKFFMESTTITHGREYFHRYPEFRGGIVILDESDQVYSVLRNIIIDELKSSFDIVTMFNTLYVSVRGSKSLAEYLSPMVNTPIDAKIESTYKELLEQLTYVHSTYGLDNCGQFYAERFGTDERYKFENFLFNHRSGISTISKSKERNASIRYLPKENRLYYDTHKPQPENDLLVFIEKASKCISNYFSLMNTVMRSLEKQEIPDIPSVSKIFRNKFQSCKMFEGSAYADTLLERLYHDWHFSDYKNKWRVSADSRMVLHGFKYHFVKTDTEYPYDPAEIFQILCLKTPELVLLDVSRSMNIMLVSATGCCPSGTCNFNLDVLTMLLGDLSAPKDIVCRMHEDCRELNEGMENIDIRVHPIGFASDAAYLHNGLDSWRELLSLGKRSVESTFSSELQDEWLTGFLDECGIIYRHSRVSDEEERSRVFLSQRLLSLGQFMKEFLIRFQRGDVPYAIFFSNASLCAGQGDGWLSRPVYSLQNAIDIFDAVVKGLGITSDREIRGSETLFDLKSKDIAKQKNEIQKRLISGMPVIMVSAYQTAGIGQNLQMKVPSHYWARTMKVGCRPEKQRDSKGAFEVNPPMLYLENRSNLVYRLDPKVRGQAERMAIAHNAIFDVCGIADRYEISFFQEKVLIRDIMKYVSYVDTELCDKDERNDSVTEKSGSGKSLRNVFSSYHILSGTKSILSECAAAIIQASGRLARSPRWFRAVDIFIDERMRMCVDWSDPELQTPVFSEIVNYLRNKGDLDIQNEPEKRFRNYASQAQERSRDNIRKLIRFGLAKDESARDIYRSLGEWLLRHPSPMECGSYSDYYVLSESGHPYYYYRLKDDGKDLEVSESYFNPIRSKSVRLLDIGATRLPTMLKCRGFKEYLESNDIPTEWTGRYVMTVYACFSIYMGRVGEIFTKWLLGGYGIVLDDMPEDAFEIMDFAFGGVKDAYLDVKNWSDNYRGQERTWEAMEQTVIDKAKSLHASKFVYVNVVEDRCVASRETVRISEVEKVEMLSIPGLIDSAGNVRIDMILKIKEFVYGKEKTFI